MIENVTNIGQILMPANQAAGKSESTNTKRFTIEDYTSKPEKSASEIRAADNKTRNPENSNKYGDIKKNEYHVEKDSNNKPVQEKNNQDNKNPKVKTKEPDDIQGSPDNEQINNEQVDVTPDSEGNEYGENILIENTEIISEEVINVSENSNSVTGNAIKSEQIKTLHETEQEQLGIKTILPGNSNGENGLKQVPSSTEQAQVEKAITGQNAPQDNTEVLANNNVEIIPPEVITNNDNQASVENAFNLTQDNKESLTGKISNGEDKIKELLTETKTAPQVHQDNDSQTQNSTESNSNTKGQNEELKIEELQTLPEGEELFDELQGKINNALNNKPEIADVLSSGISTNNDNKNLLDDNQIMVEQSFANTQTNDTQSSNAVVSDKLNVDTLRDNSEGDLTSQISKHISETIQSSTVQQGGEKQITVRLNPPELGSVMIKFSEKNSELLGTLEVSKSQTKAEIEQALPDIIKSLADSGIQLKKIDVISTENKLNNNDSQKEQFMQNENSDNSGYNENANQNQGNGNYNKSGFQQWFSNTLEYSRGYSSQNQYAGSGSINMLA